MIKWDGEGLCGPVGPGRVLPPRADGADAVDGQAGVTICTPRTRGSRMRGGCVPPTARRLRVWCGVPRGPGLGAGCGSAGRATAGPVGRTGVQVSGGECPFAPPPYLHKWQTTRRPVERARGKGVSSRNSRVAERDGHRGLHSISVYQLSCECRISVELDGVTLCSLMRACPACFRCPDRGTGAGAGPGTCRTCLAPVAAAGTEVHGGGPSGVVSPIPWPGSLALCASGVASTRLKQGRNPSPFPVHRLWECQTVRPAAMRKRLSCGPRGDAPNESGC